MEITLVQQKATPLAQFLTALFVSMVGIALAHLYYGNAEGYEFMGAFVGVIFFAIVNTVVSVFNETFVKYTLPSYGFYVLLLVIVLLSARYLSGKSIWLFGEYQMMTTSVTMFYVIGSLLVRVMRTVLEIAESDRA